MSAGQFRQSITVQEWDGTLLSSGSPDRAAARYTTFKRLRAKMESRSGTEFFSGDRDVARRNVRFITPYVTGITESMRIKHGTDIYQINGVTPSLDGRNRETHIIAERLLGSGN